ncbi:hypothetical protein EON67_12345 [archaeon]|nr:MAG: hypothetical protein EON67_12345 [archaeon]
MLSVLRALSSPRAARAYLGVWDATLGCSARPSKGSEHASPRRGAAVQRCCTCMPACALAVTCLRTHLVVEFAHCGAHNVRDLRGRAATQGVTRNAGQQQALRQWTRFSRLYNVYTAATNAARGWWSNKCTYNAAHLYKGSRRAQPRPARREALYARAALNVI